MPNNPVTQASGTYRELPLSELPTWFKPLGSKVALRRHPKADRARPGSSLFLPEQKQKNSDRATVLACGPKCRENLKTGQVVIISRFADGDRDWGGESLLVVPEDEILAVEE